jgi:hypothetical protein
LEAREPASIRKEILVVSVGSEEASVYQEGDTSGIGWD